LLKVCFGQTSLGGLTLIDSGHYLCDFSTDNAAAGSIFELSGGLLEAELSPSSFSSRRRVESSSGLSSEISENFTLGMTWFLSVSSVVKA
jgi:hypothetical protein